MSPLESAPRFPLFDRAVRAGVLDDGNALIVAPTGTARTCAFGGESLRTMQPEARFEVPLAAARVRGRIDLLLRAEGEGGNACVELVDFKTRANRPTSEMHVNQFRRYAVAGEALGARAGADRGPRPGHEWWHAAARPTGRTDARGFSGAARRVGGRDPGGTLRV